MNTGLAPGEAATVKRGALRIRWDVEGCSPQEVAVDVQLPPAALGPGPGVLTAGVQPTAANEVLVPNVGGGLVVVVRPRAAGHFGDGVSVSAQAVLQGGPFDGDQYVLPVADVSGTRAAVLLELVPVDAEVQLLVPDSVVVAGSPQRQPEHELVQRATYATRRVTGGSARLDLALRSEVHLAVDRSASLLPFIRSGAAQTVLEVLLGVNAVIGTKTRIPVRSLDSQADLLPVALHLDHVGDYWQQSVGQEARTGGTVLAPLAAATASDSRRRTVFTMTDGVPGDIGAAVDLIQRQRAAGGTTRWHLLLFARGRGSAVVDRQPWRDETGPLAEHVRRGLLDLTCIDATPDQPPLRDRLASEPHLERVVGSLAVA